MATDKFPNDDHSKFAGKDFREDHQYGPYDIGQDERNGHYHFDSKSFGKHEGKGPKNYKRSDEKIVEEANEALTRSSEVDASEIVVSAKNGVLTLTGEVSSRKQKWAAEDTVENLPFILDVENNLKIRHETRGVLDRVSGNIQHNNLYRH
jgi:hypothetical protein